MFDNQPGGEKYRKKSIITKLILPPKDMKKVNRKFDEELVAYDAQQNLTIAEENAAARKKAKAASGASGPKFSLSAKGSKSSLEPDQRSKSPSGSAHSLSSKHVEEGS